MTSCVTSQSKKRTVWVTAAGAKSSGWLWGALAGPEEDELLSPPEASPEDEDGLPPVEEPDDEPSEEEPDDDPSAELPEEFPTGVEELPPVDVLSLSSAEDEGGEADVPDEDEASPGSDVPSVPAANTTGKAEETSINTARAAISHLFGDIIGYSPLQPRYGMAAHF